MADENSNASDQGIFEKPDERRKIDREREIYLNKGGQITVYPTVQMNSKGKREAVSCVKMSYFKRGVGAKPRWYPGYLPLPANRASPEEQEAFRVYCVEKAKTKKRGKLPPTPVS